MQSKHENILIDVLGRNSILYFWIQIEKNKINNNNNLIHSKGAVLRLLSTITSFSPCDVSRFGPIHSFSFYMLKREKRGGGGSPLGQLQIKCKQIICSVDEVLAEVLRRLIRLSLCATHSLPQFHNLTSSDGLRTPSLLHTFPRWNSTEIPFLVSVICFIFRFS